MATVPIINKTEIRGNKKEFIYKQSMLQYLKQYKQIKQKGRKNATGQRKYEKDPMAYCICGAALPRSAESGYHYQHSAGFAGIPLSVYRRFWNRIYSERAKEIY